MIDRGARLIMAPGRNEQIFPSDKLSAIGTDEQLDNFKKYFENVPERLTNIQQKQEVALKQYLIKEQSPFLGQSIRESKIRERTKVIVVGIEREGKRILNPDSSMVFEKEDIVWIVGNIKRLQVLLHN